MEAYPQRAMGIPGLSEPSILTFLFPAMLSPDSEEGIAGRWVGVSRMGMYWICC